VTLVTAVPDALVFRGIEPPLAARGFAITLDEAQPQGGGRIAGRVERLNRRQDPRPVSAGVRCDACWVDIAPQMVGRERMVSWNTFAEIRNRHVPIWLDEELFRAEIELGPLAEDNWRQFSFDLPQRLPRALEGTFVAFRWRVEARRDRRLGTEHASLPLLLIETQNLPVVRVETSPIGTWRLLDWRSENEVGASGGPCSVAFEARRPDDLPLPGETREAEIVRRNSP
jgi:hypothetical protein